jgi:hypothetical protein
VLDYFDKLLMIGIVPLAVFASLFVFYYLPVTLWHRVTKPTDISEGKSREHAKNRASKTRRNMYKMAFFSVFLMYPNVSSKVLRFFLCRTIDGVSYVEYDMTEQCYSARWWAYFPAAVTSLTSQSRTRI